MESAHSAIIFDLFGTLVPTYRQHDVLAEMALVLGVDSRKFIPAFALETRNARETGEVTLEENLRVICDRLGRAASRGRRFRARRCSATIHACLACASRRRPPSDRGPEGYGLLHRSDQRLLRGGLSTVGRDVPRATHRRGHSLVSRRAQKARAPHLRPRVWGAFSRAVPVPVRW